jgi:hypothetical protein
MQALGGQWYAWMQKHKDAKAWSNPGSGSFVSRFA